MKTIGERIKRLRQENNLNQTQLAKKVNINNSVISRIEAGKKSIESSLLVELANIFNVSTDYLLGRTNTRHTKSSYSFRQTDTRDESAKESLPKTAWFNLR